MKTAVDPRHLKRVQTIKDLFAQSFTEKQRGLTQRAKVIKNHSARLDMAISKAAPEWPLNKVAKVDLAILRLATFELLVEKKEPPKVIIDEAVELAKEFGGDTSPGFINGVLGTILQSKNSHG